MADHSNETSRRKLLQRAGLVILGAGVLVQPNGGVWAADDSTDTTKKKKKKKKKDDSTTTK